MIAKALIKSPINEAKESTLTDNSYNESMRTLIASDELVKRKGKSKFASKHKDKLLKMITNQEMGKFYSNYFIDKIRDQIMQQYTSKFQISETPKAL
jgi:hypothetical protein